MNSMSLEEDMALAKDLLTGEGAQFVLVKSGRVLARSRGAGVRPLVEALDRLGEAAQGATLADRIVGRAVAVLSCQSGLSAVYGECFSEAARQTLETAGVRASWKMLVPAIFNRDRTDLCPLERLTLAIPDVSEAAAALRAHLRATSSARQGG